MRKILLTVLFVSVVCTSMLAAQQLRRTATPITNDAELRAALTSLTPTEAEAKASANLQEHAVEAEPANDDNVMINVQYQFIIGKESLMRKVFAHPAMAWNTLPVAGQFAADPLPGTAVSSVNTQAPIQVRYLEQASAQKFIETFQSQQTASAMPIAGLTLRNGEVGTVSDITRIPFVTNVIPIVRDGMIGYQPLITHIDTGQTYTTTATLLQDGSYQLASWWNITNIEKVHQFKFVVDAPIAIEDGSTGTTNITIQQPISRTLSVSMPTVVIPEGMSLLVAFPGIGFNHWHTDRNNGRTERNDGEADEAFLLITPKVARNEAQVVQLSDSLYTPYYPPDTLSPPVLRLSVEMQHLATPTPAKTGNGSVMQIIQNEWERFWMLDAPRRAANPYTPPIR
jgi:hypothetical protein